jgi:uncharacterized protein
MPVKPLDKVERELLLIIARQALEEAVKGHALPVLNLDQMTEPLREIGASFVTLTKMGDLRGCIGALEAYQPLAADVQDHAVAAGLEDYRFQPVRPDELSKIDIEISRLTPPIPVNYKDSEDLLSILRPGIDGVIIKDGRQRATFLPQVWDKVTNTTSFLNQLCQKMGVLPDTWKRKHIEVFIYQVDEFHE